MNCPNCGSQVDAGAAFCNGCGANLAAATQQPINNNQNVQPNNMQQPMNNQPENLQQPVNNQPMNNMQQPMNNMNQGMVNNQQQPYANNGGMNFFKYLINGIIRPYDNYKENENKFLDFKNGAILSVILVAITIVANVLAVIVIAYKAISAYGGSLGDVFSILKMGEFYGVIGKLALVYVATIFITAGVYFLASLIVKKDVKFPKLLGVSVTAAIPGALITCVLAPFTMLISGEVAAIFGVVGIIYTLVVLIEIVNDAIVMDNKNAKILLNMISISVILIAIALLIRIISGDSSSSELDSFGLNITGFLR